MFCKNCGKELDPSVAFCSQCGTQKGYGVRFCPNCGNELAPGAPSCFKCGCPNIAVQTPGQTTAAPAVGQKSKLAAGLLGIFLGVFGVHNFYLGYTSKAIGQLILGTAGAILCGLGPLVSGVWGLIEGIQILTGDIQKDANGNLLGE